MKRILKAVIIFIIIILAILAVLFCYFFVGKAPVPKNITWGVDFSQMQAESLGLNWKEVYLSLINDLGSKNIKIHTQWDWVEGSKNKYYFDDIDWQITQAGKNGVKVIYVLGMKSGRWPECHIPGWASTLTENQQKSEVLKYIKQTVLRYKDSKAISYWQVENEPFFVFGICPSWYYDKGNFLKEEVNLVKSLDSSRKIIVSDSGEGSTWFSAAKIGDIVGTTMYRDAWLHISDKVGFYLHYSYSPVFYFRKALLIDKIFGKKVICIEFQAEPWLSKPFNDIPLEEQYKTMDLKRLKSNIEYAKQTGFDTFYFWGAEWWYWLKSTQNQPQIWNEIKSIFSKYN